MLDFSHFEVISFDCYGTLIDWETGIFSVLRPILAAHEKSISDAALLELYGELEANEEEPPYRLYREVLQNVVRGFGRRLGFEASAEEARSLPDSMGRWNPFPDTVAALSRLKQRFRLAIISNVDEDLFAATASKLGVSFDHIITAQQARAYKPSLSNFKMAEERIGVPRDRWLHVAQSVYHDVVPAQSLGIATAWINRPSPRAVKTASAKADAEFSSLEAFAAAAVG